MGDEFALLDLATGLLMPFPRAVSLKNGAIRVMEAEVAADRFGPLLEGTPKGTIRHLRPNATALGRMGEGDPVGRQPGECRPTGRTSAAGKQRSHQTGGGQ